MKTSKLIWLLGLVGVAASGVLNAIFLYESTRMVTIQVPSHTLEPYQTIGSNDMTTKQIEAKDLEADAVTENLVGRVTAMTIPQGDQVQRFELAKQGSMAQVIQNLYLTHPKLAFAQIQVQNTGLSQTVQPGQHVNFVANNMTYPNVWVLSVTNPNGQTSISGAISQALTNDVSLNPPSTSSSQPLTMLIGADWPTVQALMSAGDTQVVMGNVGVQYSLGTPPVNQSVSNSVIGSPSQATQGASTVASGAIPNTKKTGVMKHARK